MYVYIYIVIIIRMIIIRVHTGLVTNHSLHAPDHVPSACGAVHRLGERVVSRASLIVGLGLGLRVRVELRLRLRVRVRVVRDSLMKKKS